MYNCRIRQLYINHYSLYIEISQFPDGWVSVPTEMFVHFHPERQNEVENNG